MPQIKVVGMPWHKPEHYLTMRMIFEDGDKLHGTYDEWLAAAEATYKQLSGQGVRVLRVDIDPHDFPEWCRKNRKHFNASARMEYANLEAARIATAN